jgi:cytochrome c biogenesis protein CcmG, thiol:disulfide interchange protein DsbE
MRRSTAIAIVVVAVVVSAGAWFLINHHSDPATVGPVAMASPMPVLDGESLTKQPLSSTLLKGHVAVINAWATWCAPCQHDQPILAKLARHYGSRVTFMGIDYQDQRTSAQAFWTQYHVPYESFFDPSGKFAAPLGFPYLPVIYVVDPGGTIRWQILGATDAAEVSRAVDQVLASSGSTSAQGV